MKGRFVLGMSFVIVVGLAGALAVGASPEVSEVALGVSQSPQLAAQVVVALEQGYFKKEGITPKITWTPTGREFAEAFAARAVVMGTSGEQPAINLAHRGLPVRVFAQLCEMSASLGAVVKPTVQKPDDLYGKKVAFFPGTTSELLFQGFVHRYKLDAAKMQQFHMDPPESVAAFVRGDVDAIFVWEPNVARAVKAGGKVLASGSRSYVAGQEGPHRMAPGHGTFSVSTDFAQKHPQTVRAVLRALIAGNAYLQTPENIPTVARWMNKQTNMAVEMIEVTMRSTKYMMALDPQLLEDMGVTQQFMLDKKQITRKVGPKDLYVLEPLRDVDPKLVTMKVE